LWLSTCVLGRSARFFGSDESRGVLDWVLSSVRVFLRNSSKGRSSNRSLFLLVLDQLLQSQAFDDCSVLVVRKILEIINPLSDSGAEFATSDSVHFRARVQKDGNWLCLSNTKQMPSTTGFNVLEELLLKIARKLLSL
jgi:hypothetical protein